MIGLRKVSKTFDGAPTPAVRGVSFRVDEGETVVLLGSSGCGKTTTLKMINRLIEPTAGCVEVDGRDVAAEPLLALRRSIGYVFQDIGLFPHLSIEANVAIVPRLLGWRRQRRRRRAAELLDLVGLEPERFGSRLPRQLSGGQQQRVGLARALAADPKYLLMDEPFGALDAVTRDQLQDELIELRGSLTKTIIFVTHDLFEALKLGHRIGVMHQGVLEQIGSKEELLERPASKYVSHLFEKARSQAMMLQEDAV
ncbi:MAG: ABC transporter ATP-binding protein [Phycisphaerales bacterium JB038]